MKTKYWFTQYFVTRVWLYWHDPAQADSSAALVLYELVFGCQKAANHRKIPT
jgi:hypothetical protein